MRIIGKHPITDDRKTFDELFKAHYSRLYMYALHITGEEEDSRDIVNDVFTSLWRNRKSLQPESIKAYLNTGVRNRCVDYLRKNVLKKQYTDEYIHTADEFYSDYSKELEKDKLVEKMMAQLPPPTQDILRMCYLEQKKYAEVAEILGISPNTVKKHVSKGLRILRDFYKGKQPFE